jgi:UDP-glucose 4-epimerase
MICLVTGAAGFIGSRLCKVLLEKGHSVKGIDSFTDFYPRWIKENNLAPLLANDKFEFINEDICRLDLTKTFKAPSIVFHLSAQAGVRTSWGKNFSVYTKNNIQATQKLLEAAKESPVHKFIYSSSSSVYGACPDLPMSETSPLQPYSPYGVTKLAAEHLCHLYFRNYGVPVVSLRLFTVYGPGQRPDMAFHNFFKAVLENRSISVFGDGQQTRDFTYVNDIVSAMTSSIENGKIGEIYNLGGGNRKKLEDVFPLIEDICQEKLKIQTQEKQRGDVQHTFADIKKAQTDLGYLPRTQIEEGLQEEWKWLKKIYSS